MARNSRNCGRTSASTGTIRPARTSPNTTYLPRKFRLARANAAIEQNTTVKTTVRVEMTKLLTYHQPSGLEFQAEAYASRFQLLDQKLVGLAAISSLGRSDVISAHRNGTSQIRAKRVTHVAASRLNSFPLRSASPPRRERLVPGSFVSAGGGAPPRATVRGHLRRSRGCGAGGSG